MWRANRTADDFTAEPEDLEPENEHALDPNATAPHAINAGDLRVGNVAHSTWEAWRTELAGLGGPSPLIHFTDSPRTRIELSTTHPGGLARFITGRTTLLSSLIRDDLALRSAKGAAALIAAKGLELATARGIDAVHLGIGIAKWTHEGEQYSGPVLIRPLAIRRRGTDFELRLRGATVLNPDLARALHDQFQVTLDPHAFAALAEHDGAFKPNAVIDRLRGLTSHLDDFAVSPRLVVSSFADVATGLVDDAADLAHPVLDALAGNSAAETALREGHHPVQPVPSDDRSPQTDSMLLDADPEQEQVVAQIAAGSSLVVKTLPGTGGTQTIVNALGALVAQHKRVLVVSPRRASLQAIAQRLADVGLPGLAVAPSSLRRDLIRSISRSEKAKQPDLDEVDDALVRLRKVLLDYRSALAKPDAVLGVSVLDCVTELSRLALLPEPPATTARLNRTSVEALTTDRARAADIMVAAARYGEFRYGPGDSPWYGAQFHSGEAALQAHAVAKRLHGETLPGLLARANDLIAGTHMRPFHSIDELGIYLRLLVDLRDTLDKFVPSVFDRSLSELIAATAPRRDVPDMTGGNRRRLKRLALEYVRPGVRVSDLNASLVRIQQQRVLWHRYVAEGATPQVPVGIGAVQVAYQQVSQDLASLDGPLGLSGRQTLGAMPVAELQQRLAGLAAESDVLHNLQERTALMSELRGLHLDPLIDDLARRHVPDHRVAAELEQAWWRSALESLLEQERALLGANTSVLDRLEADFRLVDAAHVSGSARKLAWQLAESWRIGLVDWPDEANALKRLLTRASVSSFDLQTTAPHLSRTLAPVWLASPYEVDSIVSTMPFDAVVLVDAGATTLAENAGAIRRGKQVVVFGDPVIQTPSRFQIAVPDRPTGRADAAPTDLHAASALARLGTLLPTLSLTRSYRPGGEDLAELVNRRFYGGRIESLPWAGSFLGHPSLTLEHIRDGHAMPDPDSGAVESPDAEVERVVDLVLDHAERRQRESLMVVTASEQHAVRVLQAVLDAAATRPELIEYIVGDRPEPFAVITIEQAVAQSRDRVIFSVGYGRTPHGRVLSDFGALGRPGGERLLAVAMTRARRSMTIVTSFEPADLDDRALHGVSALAELLLEVGARQSADPVPDDSEPMLVDLARRLDLRGVNVALGHRGKLGLVASRGGMCAAIETDTVLHRASLRESLRLRPELLRRLGWHYVRVHAFELFSDPDAVADRIATMLGVDLAAVPVPDAVPAAASSLPAPDPAARVPGPVPAVDDAVLVPDAALTADDTLCDDTPLAGDASSSASAASPVQHNLLDTEPIEVLPPLFDDA